MVDAAADASEARRKLESFAFDLLIVDVMMPGESGLSLTEGLRRASSVPIFMLSAMGETEDRIAGLERGADDYLPKPFEPRELLLRIKTALRRQRTDSANVPRSLSFGPCLFDLGRLELTRSGARVRLTETEARVLKVLDCARGRGGRAGHPDRRGRTGGQRKGDRRPDHPAAPQGGARSPGSALPANGARQGLCPDAGLTGGRAAMPNSDDRTLSPLRRFLPRSLLGRAFAADSRPADHRGPAHLALVFLRPPRPERVAAHGAESRPQHPVDRQSHAVFSRR